MNKHEFLSALENSLKGLSREDVAERMAFYSEAIDDRLEDGLTEEEAVAHMGRVEDIAAQIEREFPHVQPTKKKHRLSGLEIVLLILGSPVWISLLAAGFAVVISLYAAMWSVVVSLWAAFVSVAVSSVAGVAGMVLLCCFGNVLGGLLVLAAALFCGGLSVFMFFACMAITKGTAWLTKKSTLWLVGLFIRKERAK